MRCGTRSFLLLALGLLACGGVEEPAEAPVPVPDAPAPDPRPPEPRPAPKPLPPPPAPRPVGPPLADDPIAMTAPSLEDLRLDRAHADALMAKLQQLPKFPLRLSELEAHLGEPVRRHFNPEHILPTPAPAKDGRRVNLGGAALDHQHSEPDTPLLFELRSHYHGRYDAPGKVVGRPPYAVDDPMIDLISFSDRYANGAAPPAPAAALAFEGDYAYIGEKWHIKPLHDGFVSLFSHDLTMNPGADRWVLQLTRDRGRFYSTPEVQQVEEILFNLVDVVRTGRSVPEHLAALERTYAEDYDLGILNLGLASYNIRFFDVAIPEGEKHAGPFLHDEGRSQALYINFYIERDKKVALPNFFAMFGFGEYTVDPTQLPSVAPGHREGGLLYYNDVVLEHDGWHMRASGFYPVKDGKAQAVLEIPSFLVSSLSISYHVPLVADEGE